MSLTAKQTRFVEEYCGASKLNATASALAAGYAESSAHSTGWDNLRKPDIAKAIAKRLEKHSMSAAEATERMAEMARGNLSTKRLVRSGGGDDGASQESEEFSTESALDKVLKLHGAYQQPEGDGVKFLILGSLDDVVAKEDKPTEGANDE